MQDDRPAPPITIVDPHRATATGDLLQGREPLSRRTSRLLAAVGAVILLVSWGTSQIREQHRADARERAAADAVVIDVHTYDSSRAELEGQRYTMAGSSLTLRNDGPRDVTLLSVVVPGWQTTTRLPAKVSSQRWMTFRLSAPLRCDALPNPAEAVVRARTESGRTLVRRVPLASVDLLSATRVVCGQLPLAAALDTGSSSVTLVGKRLEVDVELLDLSTVPLRVLEASAEGAEVTLRPGPPIDLPARVPGRVPVRRLVHATVRITNCHDARPRVIGPGFAAIRFEAKTGPIGLAETAFAPSDSFLKLAQQLVTASCER